jgi:hypothetical protein
VLEMVRVPCRFACLCSLKAALLPLHGLALLSCGYFDQGDLAFEEKPLLELVHPCGVEPQTF